ncbi:MAG: XRE family transcriptional regulator [Candidatus Zixiibacteriota bacterium]
MDDKQKIGEKIKQARLEKGLTGEILGKSIGLAQETISKIENGTREVKAWELNSFSRILHKDLNYFFSSDERNEFEIRWRQEPQDVSSKKNVESDFKDIIENYDNLLDLSGDSSLKSGISLKIDNKTKPDYKFAKKLAKEIRSRFYDSDFQFQGFRKQLEIKLGIKIIELDLTNEFTAASAFYNDSWAILLNKNNIIYRSYFSIAHELFHLLTWDIVDEEFLVSPDGNKPLGEKWADCFAAELLMPEDKFKELVDGKIKNRALTFANCLYIADILNVSLEAFVYRLKFFKYITEETVAEILKRDSELRIHFRNSRGQIQESDWPISERYFKLAVNCLENGFISHSVFAKYMGINQAEIESLLKDKGYWGGDYNFEVDINYT